jgi:hypothetical protein
LRRLLLKQDASVFGVVNDDPGDLARRARVTASSELLTIDPADADPSAADDTVELQLDAELALLVPVDPELRSASVLLSAEADATLQVGLWTTGKPQNWVPIDHHRDVTVQVSAGREQWVRLPVEWSGRSPENLVIVLPAAAGVTLHAQRTQVPGVLVLPHKPGADGDENVAVEAAEPVVAWPARPLRGTSARVRLEPPTQAYAASKAVGGYQRPYGGPQLWVSQPTDFAEPEWLRLDWDDAQSIASVDLVFDDDVDVELNTLHHHRTPDVIFPELARDYAIDVLDGDDWREAMFVRDNRRRHRRHDLEAAGVRALRVRILASNGAPQARVISLRVY